MIDEDKLESPKSFYLELPLYKEFELKDVGIFKKIYSLLHFSDKIDVYCIWCKRDSVFSVSLNYNESLDHWSSFDRFNRITLECSRIPQHEYYVDYYKRGKIFQKIGQFPSVADFQIPQAEKYRLLLGEEQYKELTKGIGLYAHGVGIGSFVYLRRIFENLIEEEYLKIKDSEGFDEDGYQQARMDKKITILKDSLPEFLVANKNLYSILSRGIHELTEEECLKYFVPIRIGIEQILDEKISVIEKLRKAKEAAEAVQTVGQELSARNKPSKSEKAE